MLRSDDDEPRHLILNACVRAREEKAFNMCSIRARRALRIYPELTYVNWPKNSRKGVPLNEAKQKVKKKKSLAETRAEVNTKYYHKTTASFLQQRAIFAIKT